MSRKLVLSALALFIINLVMAQLVKREYQTDNLHDPNRPNPERVIPGEAVFSSPPSDAIVLFDGDNLEAWEGEFILSGNGTMVAAKGGLKTRQSFGDIQLHLEWRMNDTLKVKGQSGGNSGVYLMGRYEVQILESFVNKTYADGQAGAMYGQYPPIVNAATPQGNWNSYDIIFKAPIYKGGKVIEKATVTVLHNGVAVQVNQEYEGPSTYKKITSYPENHPLKAPISLQYHNDPVEFRNIWVRELKVTEEEAGANSGWINPFPKGGLGVDYEVSMEDDKFDQEHFEVGENTIETLYKWEGEEAPFALITTTKHYSSYNLELEYKWGDRKFAPRHEAKRDAGILFHIYKEPVVWPSSVECQIQEEDTGDLWVIKGPKLNVKNQDGSERFVDSAVKEYERSIRYDNFEINGWNHVRVEVRGDKSARFFVNGHLVNEVFDMKDENGDPLSKGRVALQAEGAELIYRNIRLQNID
ncbi:MAG: DUF1080 domain-containing protein [Cyclobacteriaceae bacterium]